MCELQTSKLFVVPLLLMFLLVSTGCATIFHNDRVNQPNESKGDVDWVMVVLDVVFAAVVVGLIVDLATGALWVPKAAPAAKTAS